MEGLGRLYPVLLYGYRQKPISLKPAATNGRGGEEPRPIFKLFVGIDFRLAIFSLANFVLIEPTSGAIGCFVCSSVNGSNPDCEDPFNSSILTSVRGSVGLFQQPCWAFRKNRRGLFPADHCIKVSGHRYDHPNHTLLIRTCALDSGSLTADTVIVDTSNSNAIIMTDACQVVTRTGAILPKQVSLFHHNFYCSVYSHF
uniref:ZP domain-containing protein n=1 Tax=Globodera pallida TaxID=36090 RepID=A0A183BV79_GLOPA